VKRLYGQNDLQGLISFEEENDLMMMISYFMLANEF
jgi:hypothetical protein